MRYENVGSIKESGAVYTPPEMADYVSAEMLKYKKQRTYNEITILDPATGEGDLLISLIKAVRVYEGKIKVVGYETNKTASQTAKKRIKEFFPEVNVEIREENFLEAAEAGTVGKYDFVIANPPYIRTQIIGSDRAQEMAKKLSLSGRVDIYYAFLLYAKEVLKPDGIAGYITSNKFMTIKAGTSVRNYMLNNYQIYHIIDLGDTKLFAASVLPCIIIFSLGKTLDKDQVSFTSVYQEANSDINAYPVCSLFDSISESCVSRIPDGRCYRYKQGFIQSVDSDCLWTISSEENREWLLKVKAKTWRTFSQIGKVRVGIKTTADNVFIGDDWSGEKADIELLRPLITHRNAGQIVANKQSQWKVLYTHKMECGKRVAYNIDRYPKSKKYLLQHYEQLNGRSYIKKAHRNWYEIWVPQNPDAWRHRKIVFRDISEKPQFWLDETGAIVNGDCYWIDIHSDVPEDVVYLALAIANSKFIERYYDIRFNTKLYSGKRRYQSQYVEQFPIPYYDSPLAHQAISLVKKIISESNDEIALGYKTDLDSTVEAMFC